MPVVDFVLATPRKEALEEFEHACQRGAEACAYLVEHGLEKTQNTFN